MTSTGFPRRRWKTAVFAVLLSAAIIASGLFFLGQPLLSSFMLSGGHASEGMRCTICHNSSFDESTCQACHEDIAGSRQSTGLHKGTGEMVCGDCHKMHGQAQRALVRGFAHRNTGFTLDEHGGQTCTDCHTGDLVSNVDPACIDCHLGNDPPEPDELEEVQEHLDQLSLLPRYSRLKNSEMPCLDCHVGGERLEFQHDSEISWFFVGDHNEKLSQCKRCHMDLVWEFNARDCEICHETTPPMGK